MKRFFLPLLFFFPLTAEILTVDLTWNKSLCDEGCNELIRKRYNQVPEIDTIEVGPGYMTLNWKPGAPFSYLKIRRPMQRVGVHIQGIAVTARGTVKREGEQFYLVSTGDGTEFELTSPPPPKTTGGYTSYSNRKLYQLLPEIKTELTNAMANKETIKVTGYLLMPYRLPLTLIIGNFSKEPLPMLDVEKKEVVPKKASTLPGRTTSYP